MKCAFYSATEVCRNWFGPTSKVTVRSRPLFSMRTIPAEVVIFRRDAAAVKWNLIMGRLGVYWPESDAIIKPHGPDVARKIDRQKERPSYRLSRPGTAKDIEIKVRSKQPVATAYRNAAGSPHT